MLLKHSKVRTLAVTLLRDVRRIAPTHVMIPIRIVVTLVRKVTWRIPTRSMLIIRRVLFPGEMRQIAPRKRISRVVPLLLSLTFIRPTLLILLRLLRKLCRALHMKQRTIPISRRNGPKMKVVYLRLNVRRNGRFTTRKRHVNRDTVLVPRTTSVIPMGASLAFVFIVRRILLLKTLRQLPMKVMLVLCRHALRMEAIVFVRQIRRSMDLVHWSLRIIVCRNLTNLKRRLNKRPMLVLYW